VTDYVIANYVIMKQNRKKEKTEKISNDNTATAESTHTFHFREA